MYQIPYHRRRSSRQRARPNPILGIRRRESERKPGVTVCEQYGVLHCRTYRELSRSRFQRQLDSIHLQLENRNQRFQASSDAVFQEPKADGMAFADWQNELAMVQRSEVPRCYSFRSSA